MNRTLSNCLRAAVFALATLGATSILVVAGLNDQANAEAQAAQRACVSGCGTTNGK